MHTMLHVHTDNALSIILNIVVTFRYTDKSMLSLSLTHTRKYTHETHSHSHTCTHILTHTHTHTHTHAHTHKHKHMHIHIYKHTHTRTHTQTCCMGAYIRDGQSTHHRLAGTPMKVSAQGTATDFDFEEDLADDQMSLVCEGEERERRREIVCM